ncbi:MAG: AMP-binding protein [Lachnospiraceae bacterium]|nr:AMP-binding protein [Lachnospiraceae bacterium]
MITYESIKTIADLVKAAGEVHKERVFLRYEKDDNIKDITFCQLMASVTAVAGWAEEKSKEAGHPVRVGVLGGSSYPYLAALLGVMANGNVVVPLDVQLNMQSLREYADHADLDYLFYEWEYFERAEGAKELCTNLQGIICLENRKHVDSIQKIWKEYTNYTLDKEINPKDCAMLLFTSGTTGKGKGVLLSHENLIDNVFCTEDDGHPENEVYMNVLPVHHIFCLNGDFLLGLRYGNVLCLNQDMTKLAAHIQLFQPTVIRMVPMMAKTLYNRIAVLKEQYKEKSIDEIKSLVLGKCLHKIVSGGGYLAPELAKCYGEIGISIAQGYGMSECSPKISAPDWNRPDKVSSVGRIVSRCQVRIVDGEIQVKSPSVMMGYYKDPEETAKTITEDGWLRTGDLGYIDEEGFLFFTGRCKNLIILSNGENVAPEQLENLFVDETLIEDILVYGEEDKICAEVYPNLQLAETAGIEDLEQAIADIIKKHNEDLPSYKRILQSHVRYIPFEKTSSKKIIRGKYFEQKEKQKEALAKLKLPENETQQKIYNAVAESLGHQKFGIDTDLYEAGLDSLGSVMLLSALYDKMQISINLQELSQHATVEKLEAFAKEKEENTAAYEVQQVYPLTGLQTYFGYILRGNTTSNLPFLFKLDSSVDLERLKAATEQVFEIHPELKDIIMPQEGVLKNFRDDSRKIDIPIYEMTDAEWENVRKNLIYPFMYTENEPLFHAGIYKMPSGNYFFFDLAHIIGDGMSMNVIFEDINAIYKGEEVRKQTYTLYEYILDEMARKERGGIEEDVKYFLQQTNNLKIKKSILTCNSRKSAESNLAKGINCSLRGRLNDIGKKKIQAFCQKHGVSENVLFLTAFNYCISVFANEDDVLSTSIHSGRTDSRWNRLTGALFTTYYFRYTRKPHETVPELLQKSAKQILRTMDCHTSNLHADEMFFQYQGDILNINEIGGAPAERQKLQLDALPFHLQVMSDKKGYFYELRYWENRYDKAQLEVFMRCFEAILQAMQTESSVRRLKKYIADSDRPKHFYIEAGKINEAAGYALIPDVSSDTKCKPYVLDSSCLKKPFGGWGDLYIMDYPTKEYVDQMENPYGEGTLYQTGLTARITPAGEVEFLENVGRTVMIEGLKGRHFIDLYQVERALCMYEGITGAKAYTYYGADNSIHVGADITIADGKNKEMPEDETLKAYLADKLHPVWIPEKININPV